MQGPGSLDQNTQYQQQEVQQIFAQTSNVQQFLSQNYDKQYLPQVSWNANNNQINGGNIQINTIIDNYSMRGGEGGFYTRPLQTTLPGVESQNTGQQNPPNDSPLQPPSHTNTLSTEQIAHRNASHWENSKAVTEQADEGNRTIKVRNMYGEQLAEYQAGQVLGQGGFGKVFVGTLSEGNRPIAVKRIEKPNFDHFNTNYEWTQLEREVDALKNLKHPNLVSYEGHARSGRETFLILMEFCEGGNLVNFYNRNRSILPIAYWFKAFQDMASGLLAMHTQGYVHRDLKPENVLIKQNAQTGEIQFKISDFGSTKQYQQNQTRQLTLRVGTLFYQAPELIALDTGLIAPGSVDVRVDALDIWSLGTIFYIVLSGGQHPFLENWQEAHVIRNGLFGVQQQNERQSAVNYRERLLTRYLPLRPSTAEQPQYDIVTLIGMMLSADPQQRPTIQQVYQYLEQIWNTYRDSPFWNQTTFKQN